MRVSTGLTVAFMEEGDTDTKWKRNAMHSAQIVIDHNGNVIKNTYGPITKTESTEEK